MSTAISAAVAAVLVGSSQAAVAEDHLGDAAEVVVIGERINLDKTPGSGDIIDQQTLEDSRVFTVNEAMRKVPGVFARDEEGFGMRPNIGIRGLNPTRSTKVLLLEDGLPLTYAPYGDNASYYHPPVDRFERIEILKGSGQIAFGPQTVGGVINYITPRPPEEFSGKLGIEGGSSEYSAVHGRIGDTVERTGYVLNVTRKETDGARENMHFDVLDVNAKVTHELTDDQALTFRASYYDENSDVPYSGLTLAEYQANPRANPFVNDEFNVYRWGASLSHRADLSDVLSLTTSAYYTSFNRDWWRQSSNSSQRPNDASDLNCSGMQNLLSTCGNEGRLREYWTSGIESRLAWRHTLFGVDTETDAGVRLHREDQNRLQINSDTPTGRTPGTSRNAGVRENSDRTVDAISAFAQMHFLLGKWTLTPGMRFETIDYVRVENLTNARGESDVDQWVPGLGATYQLTDGTMLFAGAHRGFSPPAVPDIITPTGGSTDLDPELSWNYELGLRSTVRPGLRGELTLFRMDFENQVVPSSLASNACGATLCNAGETLHQGAEALVRFDSADWFSAEENIFFQAAYTWLDTAEYSGNRTSNVAAGVNVEGNRLPYAPKQLFSATVGVELPVGLKLQIEGVYNSDMFTDDLNTVSITTNGQRGLIPSHTVLNVSANYAVPNTGWTMFVTSKNVLDKVYIVDMSRGLIPGMQRLVYGGVSYKF